MEDSRKSGIMVILLQNTSKHGMKSKMAKIDYIWPWSVPLSEFEPSTTCRSVVVKALRY